MAWLARPFRAVYYPRNVVYYRRLLFDDGEMRRDATAWAVSEFRGVPALNVRFQTRLVQSADVLATLLSRHFVGDQLDD